MRIIGFTGTRQGMTPRQKKELADFLRPEDIFHHGDCVGADAEAHEIARGVGCRIVLHPPTDEKMRAFCKADEERASAPYLDRNRQIVKSSELLVAAPKEDPEHPCRRSGTWATIRAAQRAETAVIILQR